MKFILYLVSAVFFLNAVGYHPILPVVKIIKKQQSNLLLNELFDISPDINFPILKASTSVSKIYKNNFGGKTIEALNYFVKQFNTKNKNANKLPFNRLIRKTIHNFHFQEYSFCEIVLSFSRLHNFELKNYYTPPDPFRLTPPPQIFMA